MPILHDHKAWHGIWTALVTPLRSVPGDRDAVALDEESLEGLIREQIQAGVRGLVIAGSTGEGSLLPPAVLERLLVCAKEMTGTRVPLVAGLGIGGTAACLEALRRAKNFGYDGVLASPPAYIKAPQRGLAAHFLRLAEEGLPVCVYEIPGRAASSLSVETLVTMRNDKSPTARRLVALKDATGDLARAKAQAEQLGEKMALLSGDDGSFAEFIQAGGHGCISVASHFVARALERIRTSPADEARAQQNKLNKFIDALFWESNPIPVKSLLAARGLLQEARFCSPLLPMDSSRLKELVDQYILAGPPNQ